MNATAPALSVVLPVYNAAPFLDEAVTSILEQDFCDFECIAIDDGSTDASAEILDEYGRRDARLRVFHQPNVGVVETLNRAIGLARAPLVARMDADDVCLPGRFTAQIRHFDGRVDLGVLGGQVRLIDEDGNFLRMADYPTGPEELEALLSRNSPVAHPAVMLRKDAVQKVGLYRRAFKHAEDYDLWLRLHEAGYGIENLKLPLINYRQHSGKISIVHRHEQAIATLAARCAHRVRAAGRSDPTADLNSLDEQVFERFTPVLAADFQEDLFFVRLGMTPLEPADQLRRAHSEFRALPTNLQRTRNATRFLLQMTVTAWAHRHYLLAAASVARAVVTSPVGFVSIVTQRLVRSLRSPRPEHAPRSRANLTASTDPK